MIFSKKKVINDEQPESETHSQNRAVMIRKLVSRFNESLRDYLSSSSSSSSSRRRNICVPVTISIMPEDPCRLSRRGGRRSEPEIDDESATLSVKGVTKDLSENGLAFIVPSVRLGQHYLVGQARLTLGITLDLPNGKVCFKAVGERYEQFGESASAAVKYLIGASITEISVADRNAFTEYLRQAQKAQKSEKLALGVSNN